MSKIKKILNKLNIINDKEDNSLLLNLVKVPEREKPPNVPHYTATKANARHQVDLLYLKEDKGYKYLLVCVDIATRKCDAVPLKVRDAKTVRDALKKIYSRGILRLPTVDIQADKGTEFQKEFKTYFSKITKVFYKLTARSRQQAVVEAKNKQIGAIINAKILADEINNDDVSVSWVSILPKVIKAINEEYTQAPHKVDMEKPILVDKKTQDLLPVGTKVRVILNHPKDYVNGGRLGGKFRGGDIRWSKEAHTITQVLLNPGETPMYQVDGSNGVAYTKMQLSVIKDDEVKPNSDRQYAQEIVDKRKVKNKVEYKIRWEDGSFTFQPRSEIIDDLKDMIKEYEKKK